MFDSSFANSSIRDPSKFRINTKHFSPHDLSLFVDCLETITRLTCAKRERLERIKINNSLRNLPNINSSNEAKIEADLNVKLFESGETPTASDGDKSESDETYFSAPSSSQSSPRRNGMHQKKMCEVSINSSDTCVNSYSEESGVYAMGSTQQIPSIFETPTKLNSEEVTKMNTPLKISRFFSTMWKKESRKANSVTLVASRALDEYEILDMYQQQQQQQQKHMTMQQQKSHHKSSRFSNLHLKKFFRQEYALTAGSSHERFFDKALRHLTL